MAEKLEYTVDDVPDHNGDYCIRTLWDGVIMGNSWRNGEEARDEHTQWLESEGYTRKGAPKTVAKQPWLS